MGRASGQAIVSSFERDAHRRAVQPVGPATVRFVKRELLDSGAVVWAFHPRCFDKLE
jgi:hypothetical protein